MDIYELAAWVIDFEGYIIIGRSFNNETQQFSYAAKVGIDGCSLSHLQRFQERIGFGYVNPNPKIVERGNNQYTWLMSRVDLNQHLIKIEEYLFLKRRQAQILLEFENHKMPASLSAQFRAGYYTATTRNILDDLYNQCKELNKKILPQRTEQEEFYRQLRRR
jgi:hypothetical protein